MSTTPNSLQTNPGEPSYTDITGKPTVWYHGIRYTLEELWQDALARRAADVRKCLKAGLNVNYCRWLHDDKLGHGVRSITDVVAAQNNIRTMHVLLEFNVDLSAMTVQQLAQNRGSKSSYMHGIKPNVDKDDLWTTPLHQACKYGHLGMIETLVIDGHMNADILDSKKRSSLLQATRQAHSTTVIGCLLRLGANVQLGAPTLSPLANAAFLGNAEDVTLLLDHGAWIEAPALENVTAFYLAAVESKRQVLPILAARGANVEARDTNGFSPFLVVAGQCDFVTMDVLVECGVDVDSEDLNGCSVLMRATMARNYPLMEYLLKQGADIDSTNHDGWSPLFAAMLTGDDTATRTLLINGCNLQKPDRNGNTPLHQSCILGSAMTVRHIIQSTSQNQSQRENLYGETPLILACKYNQSSCVRLLLKHGTDAQVQTSTGITALDAAMYHGSYACFRLLLQAGVNISAASLQAWRQGKASVSTQGHKMIETFLHQTFGPPPPSDNAITQNQQNSIARKQSPSELTARLNVLRGIDKKDARDPFEPLIPDTITTELPVIQSGKPGIPGKAVLAGVAAGAAGEVLIGQVGGNLVAAALGL